MNLIVIIVIIIIIFIRRPAGRITKVVNSIIFIVQMGKLSHRRLSDLSLSLVQSFHDWPLYGGGGIKDSPLCGLCCAVGGDWTGE